LTSWDITFSVVVGWPRETSLTTLKDAIQAKTRRTVGRRLPRVIADVNPTLRGWYGYFRHGGRPTVRKLDGQVRRRLRSILRQQQGREGSAATHVADHVRWPNTYFAVRGLFSLQGACDAVSLSS
jgi:RNA-directed DNA polymerase